MKIAILSDSHGAKDLLLQCFNYCNNNGIFDVIHAGDFLFDGVSDVFDDFNNIRFYIAIGNCDVNEYELSKVRSKKNVQIDNDVKFFLYNKKILLSHKKKNNIEKDINVYVYGHTHLYFFDKNNNKIIINPGSLYESRMFLVFDLYIYDVFKIFLK